MKPGAAEDHLADNQTVELVAEVPDMIYLDVPDQDGWGKMAEL